MEVASSRFSGKKGCQNFAKRFQRGFHTWPDLAGFWPDYSFVPFFTRWWTVEGPLSRRSSSPSSPNSPRALRACRMLTSGADWQCYRLYNLTAASDRLEWPEDRLDDLPPLLMIVRGIDGIAAGSSVWVMFKSAGKKVQLSRPVDLIGPVRRPGRLQGDEAGSASTRGLQVSPEKLLLPIFVSPPRTKGRKRRTRGGERESCHQKKQVQPEPKECEIPPHPGGLSSFQRLFRR